MLQTLKINQIKMILYNSKTNNRIIKKQRKEIKVKKEEKKDKEYNIKQHNKNNKPIILMKDGLLYLKTTS